MKDKDIKNKDIQGKNLKEVIKEEIKKVKENIVTDKRKSKLVNYVLSNKDYKKNFNKVVEIDLSNIKDKMQLHGVLKEKFKFDDYYGNNLDALNDMLGEINESTLIEITNFKDLKASLKDYAQSFKLVLMEAQGSNGFIKVKIK